MIIAIHSPSRERAMEMWATPIVEKGSANRLFFWRSQENNLSWRIQMELHKHASLIAYLNIIKKGKKHVQAYWCGDFTRHLNCVIMYLYSKHNYMITK